MCFIRSVKSPSPSRWRIADELGDRLARSVRGSTGPCARELVGLVARLLADAGQLQQAGQVDAGRCR